MSRLSIYGRWRYCLSLCCLVAWAAGPARAGLTLGLSSTRTQYLVDERFCVTITLANAGAGDAAITDLLAPDVGIVSFEIATPDGSRHRYEPQGRATLTEDAGAKSVLWLRPGGHYTASVDLSYEMKPLPPGAAGPLYAVDGAVNVQPAEPEWGPAMTLSDPGGYAIRACYAIPGNWPLPPLTLWSDTLAVSVAEPTGGDLAAYQVLRAGPRTRRYGIWNAFSDHAGTYEQVLRDYPECAYGIYARWSLGSARSFSGSHLLRGTPEAVGELESAADLFLSVARDAGQDPSGLRATEAAAKVLSELGRHGEAQALLEDAFAWPATADNDRSRLLTWLHHIETGYFQREAGAVPLGAVPRVSLPLRSFAEALGFTVQWDAEKGEERMTAPGVEAVLHAGEDQMLVNGAPQGPIASELVSGEPHVSPSAIRILMDAKYRRAAAAP